MSRSSHPPLLSVAEVCSVRASPRGVIVAAVDVASVSSTLGARSCLGAFSASMQRSLSARFTAPSRQATRVLECIGEAPMMLTGVPLSTGLGGVRQWLLPPTLAHKLSAPCGPRGGALSPRIGPSVGWQGNRPPAKPLAAPCHCCASASISTSSNAAMSSTGTAPATGGVVLPKRWRARGT